MTMRSICVSPPIHVPVTLQHVPERGIWVTHVPALDIYSQGTTEQRALDALQEAVTMYLAHLPTDDKRTQAIARLLGIGAAP